MKINGKDNNNKTSADTIHVILIKIDIDPRLPYLVIVRRKRNRSYIESVVNCISVLHCNTIDLNRIYVIIQDIREKPLILIW